MCSGDGGGVELRGFANRLRRVEGFTVGILFMAAVMAAVIFGFLPVMDLGPVTGIWLGFVVAGFGILGIAFVYTWVQYLRSPQASESGEGRD